ncbi:tail fiber domain-containing protein [Franconibacter pulveris 1160]
MSAWYRSGTIAVAGKTVTGTGTNWTDNKMGIGPGQALLIPGAGTVKVYEISRVDSATQLTLNDDAGTVAAGQAYAIMSFYSDSVPDFARRLSAQLSYYQSQMDGWQEIMTGTGSITLEAPDGTQVTVSSFKKLTDDLAGKAGLVNGAVPVKQGGTGAQDKDTAWNNLAKYGTAANTAAQGNDSRLNTVDGKSGGTISSAVTVNSSVTSKTGNGFAVAAGESNRVELNNALTSGATGNPVGWTVYRWYNELVQTGIRRAGDTTIQSYFIALSAVGSFEFLRSGTATAPGTWQNGSDERHKTNIKLVQNPLAAVLSLRGVTYDKKDGTSEVGLIAQDAEKFCHEAVSTNGDRKFMDGTVIPAFKYLNTSGLAAAYHTEAIKDIFELLYQIAEDPAAALKTMDAIREQAEQIKAQPVEQAAPWKEEPPVFDVPSVPDSVAESEPVGQQAQDSGEENQ